MILPVYFLCSLYVSEEMGAVPQMNRRCCDQLDKGCFQTCFHNILLNMAGNILGSTCFPQQLKLQFQKTACATPFSLSEKMFFNVMRNIFQWLEKYLFELLPAGCDRFEPGHYKMEEDVDLGVETQGAHKVERAVFHDTSPGTVDRGEG